MARNLTINSAAVPFKSSNLAIPPSPFTPRLPLTPPDSPSTKDNPSSEHRKRSAKLQLEVAPPPSDPLRWLWQCHVCNRVYQLGVTRKCLDDGHLFCAGTTTIKKSRRTNRQIIRHKACASEFDYQGWKAWGNWRRSAIEQLDATVDSEITDEETSLRPNVSHKGPTSGGALAKNGPKDHKDCWNVCDYPSECRWGKQHGVGNASATTATVPSTAALKDSKSGTSFNDILLAVQSDKDPSETSNVRSQQTMSTSSAVTTRKPSMDDLLESVKRRKRRSAGGMPSPLSSNPPSAKASKGFSSSEGEPPEGSSKSSTLQKAFDDFELDVKKSFERTGDLVNGWASTFRSSAGQEDQKSDMVVKGLKLTKKSSRSSLK